MPRKRYFKPVEDSPPPLCATVSQRVRFEECDPLGIVWHGRFTSYFEDARVALCEQHGIGYMDFYRRDVVIPLKQMYHDYVTPLRFNETFSTECRLHWTDAARLNFEFIIRKDQNEIVATGATIHLMLTRDFELLLTPPPFYLAFMQCWKAGSLS
jgi:acyl-CoA thioester hydrolase